MSRTPFGLLDVVGIELEYMIVDREKFDVLPVADKVLAAQAGRITGDVELGEITWSNELALHVLEMKTTRPADQVEHFVPLFQEHVERLNTLLEPHGGRLMPGAMHPWMDPDREMRLWPHAYSAVYEAFDRIFSTRGHGWANLQSMHLNLPFSNDEEFARLHSAIRLLLPIMPALTASSPIMDGRATGLLDSRLDVYRTNSARIPSITGLVAPEPVSSRAEYEKVILGRMYEDVAPFDPDRVLQHEWLNARGAIARFDRGAIEIRVLDVQECPEADLAVCAAITTALGWLVGGSVTSEAEQREYATEALHALLLKVIRDADEAVIDDPSYLRHFDWQDGPCTTGQLWRHLADNWLADCRMPFLHSGRHAALETILDEGPLARRILRALDGDTSRPRLAAVYGRLADCLRDGELFQASPS